MRRWSRRIGVASLATAAMLGSFWAGRVTMVAPSSTETRPAPRTATAATATVGKSLTLSVRVTQDFQPVAANALPGVVTAVAPDGPVKEGSMLYAVNAAPVRAVQGTIPFFRSLKVGDRGPDVAQLEQFLVRAGMLRTADGTFDISTKEALMTWRRHVGDAPAPEVGFGTLIAFPALPTAIKVDNKVLRPGKVLAGGEEGLSAPVGQPVFSLVVSQEQAALLDPGDKVHFVAHNQKFEAVVGDRHEDENGQTAFTLQGPDRTAVCGQRCALFASTPSADYVGQVEVIPSVTGPAVPVAALETDPSGQAWLSVVGHDEIVKTPVTVKGSQDGVAVVEGIAAGSTVLLPSPSETPR